MENTENTKLLYSQRAFLIATFLGGPLAAGILARQNFINLDKEKLGFYALITGIITTILLYIGIFLIPEIIIDKIPTPLIPAIYTAIILFIVEKLQGNDLREHKEHNGKFYSIWKTLSIGALCLMIIIAGLFGYAASTKTNFESEYNTGIATINSNETKALELFSIIETGNVQNSINFIDSVGIPLWKSNLEIINNLDTIEGLYEELKKQNAVLRDYNKLRIESYLLIRKALLENTDIYDLEIEKLNTRINLEFEKL